MPMTGVSTLSPKIALVLLGLGGISQPCEPQLVSHTLVRLGKYWKFPSTPHHTHIMLIPIIIIS